MSIHDYRSYYSQVNFDPRKKKSHEPSGNMLTPEAEDQPQNAKTGERDVKAEAAILKEFFEKFDIELIEEVVGEFETVEDAYDHLSEFYEMKVFDIIDDYGQEDEVGQQESSEESDQWEEVKTTHGKKGGKLTGKKKEAPKVPESIFSEQNIYRSKSSVELDQPADN